MNMKVGDIIHFYAYKILDVCVNKLFQIYKEKFCIQSTFHTENICKIWILNRFWVEMG